MSDSIVTAVRLGKRIGERAILNDITATVEPGTDTTAFTCPDP